MSALHAASAALFDLAGMRIATVTVVVDELAPQVIIFEGEPFLFDHLSGALLCYLQTRPYRADGMAINEMRSPKI